MEILDSLTTVKGSNWFCEQVAALALWWSSTPNAVRELGRMTQFARVGALRNGC